MDDAFSKGNGNFGRPLHRICIHFSDVQINQYLIERPCFLSDVWWLAGTLAWRTYFLQGLAELVTLANTLPPDIISCQTSILHANDTSWFLPEQAREYPKNLILLRQGLTLLMYKRYAHVLTSRSLTNTCRSLQSRCCNIQQISRMLLKLTALHSCNRGVFGGEGVGGGGCPGNLPPLDQRTASAGPSANLMVGEASNGIHREIYWRRGAGTTETDMTWHAKF